MLCKNFCILLKEPWICRCREFGSSTGCFHSNDLRGAGSTLRLCHFRLVCWNFYVAQQLLQWAARDSLVLLSVVLRVVLLTVAKVVGGSVRAVRDVILEHLHHQQTVLWSWIRCSLCLPIPRGRCFYVSLSTVRDLYFSQNCSSYGDVISEHLFLSSSWREVTRTRSSVHLWRGVMLL